LPSEPVEAVGLYFYRVRDLDLDTDRAPNNYLTIRGLGGRRDITPTVLDLYFILDRRQV
jgi:hypothetical protein